MKLPGLEEVMEREGRAVFVPMSNIGEWMEGMLRQSHASSLKLISLFGGERASCCDEAAVVVDEGVFLAVASIAPFGEGRNPAMEKMAQDPDLKEMAAQYGYGEPAEPTIVGVFVLPEYRLQGLGCQVLEAAVRRCVERRLVPVRIDSMSAGIMRAIEKLPPELRGVVQVNDMGGFMDVMPG